MTGAAPPAVKTESEIRHRIWQELRRATQDRHHEWRTPVLATVDSDGFPHARTVVLRHADTKLAVLQMYTDSRSPKVFHLKDKPATTVVFWSKRLGWQLRVRAIASVQISGPEVDAVWDKVSQSPAAGDYLSVNAPGQKLRADGSDGADHAPSDHPVSASWQKPHHLGILTLQVQEIDWLELVRSGHRRAVMHTDSWEWRVP